MPAKSPPFVLRRLPGFLIVDLPAPVHCLSWAPHGGGVTQTCRVVWHGVTPDSLPRGADPLILLRKRLGEADLMPCVAMMTSRDLHYVHCAESRVEEVAAHAIVTAGYSNAVRVGDPVAHPTLHAPGTINVLCHLDVPLTVPAQIEVMSLVAEARTLAAIEHPVRSVQSDALATGTGTDCITVVSPLEEGAARRSYAGKHTAVGSAAGAASLAALREATRVWHRQRASKATSGSTEPRR